MHFRELGVYSRLYVAGYGVVGELEDGEMRWGVADRVCVCLEMD